MYKIERTAIQEALNYGQIKELRLEKALPVFNKIGEYLYDNINSTLPKSPIVQAMSYFLSIIESLRAYLYDGALQIDNNLGNGSIRATAIGHKNYLFAGFRAGAEKAAMFYTFFGTCKAHKVNPLKWLLFVLDNIHKYSAENLDKLFPANLAKMHPELIQN